MQRNLVIRIGDMAPEFLTTSDNYPATDGDVPDEGAYERHDDCDGAAGGRAFRLPAADSLAFHLSLSPKKDDDSPVRKKEKKEP